MNFINFTRLFEELVVVHGVREIFTTTTTTTEQDGLAVTFYTNFRQVPCYESLPGHRLLRPSCFVSSVPPPISG